MALVLEIDVNASGNVAYLIVMLIAAAFCCRKALSRAILKWIGRQK
ncbi:hypothetical protein AB0N16_21765 [Streptomyces sp. NPDC051105]